MLAEKMNKQILKVEDSLKNNFLKSYNDLPASLSVNDLALILGISKSQAYILINSKGFPKLMVGEARVCVPKSAFLQWVSKQIPDYDLDFEIGNIRKGLKEKVVAQMASQQQLITQILQQQTELQKLLNEL